ncbi:MAG: hypothetical protein AAB403_23180 [Planctomycetota bacterium]
MALLTWRVLWEWLHLRRPGWYFATFSTMWWLVVLLAPYLVIGEQWGTIWVYLVWPFSMWLKFTWDSDNPWFYVFLATAIDAVALFLCVWLYQLLLAKVFDHVSTSAD